MIPYGNDITDNDIRNYWGNGYVMIELDDVWSMYRLEEVAGNRFKLRKSPSEGMSSKDAPDEIQLTRDQFFEQVLLHRPELGVVLASDGGSLLHLGWVPAHGDQIKALTSKDIHITRLCKRPVLNPMEQVRDLEPLANDKYLPYNLVMLALQGKQVSKERGSGLLRESALFQLRPKRDVLLRRRGDDPGHKGNLKLVVSYLNHKQNSFHGAYIEAMANHFATIKRDWWLKGSAKGALLYAGQTVLGHVILKENKEAMFKVKAGTSKKQATVLTAIAGAILAGYNINIIQEKANAIAKKP